MQAQDTGELAATFRHDEKSSIIVTTFDYTQVFKKQMVNIAVDYNNNRESVHQMAKLYPNTVKNLDERLMRDWGDNPPLNHCVEWDKAHLNRTEFRMLTSLYITREEDLILSIKKRRENFERLSRDWIILLPIIGAIKPGSS